MADLGIVEYVEGIAADGKELERLTEDKLEELQKQVMHERIKVNQMLTKETEELRTLQDKLNFINDRLEVTKREIDEKRPQQSMTLSGEQEGRIKRLTEDTLDEFVTLRPRRLDEEVSVDVRFQPGKESVGLNLHIGGEGAGSLLAKFRVRLNQKVQDLAVQAAKYWGLDADKVFFLDRSSRILPDSMLLSEIILPPSADPSDASRRAASSSSSSAAMPQARGGAGAIVPYQGGPLAVGGDAEQTLCPILEGRNYNLTLVRAGTVLSKEDLSKPKGEEWNDFTFENARLEQELENIRKKHGDAGAVAKAVNMDDIPSLFDLQQQGLLRKMRKRWDTRCRILEFVLFVFCQLAFLYLLSPNDKFSAQMRMMARAVEKEYLNTSHFLEIKTHIEYANYLDTTLSSAIVFPGMNDTNMFVLGALGNLYEGTSQSLDLCASDIDDAANDTNGSNGSNSSLLRRMTFLEPTDQEQLNARFDDGSRHLSDLLNDTVASNVTEAPETCPRQLQDCQTPRALGILKRGVSEGHQVPGCQAQYSLELMDALGAATTGFGYIWGHTQVYANSIEVDMNVTDPVGFQASLEPFRNSIDDIGNDMYVAKLINVFVYSPTVNGMFIFRLLSEQSLSGTLITRVRQLAFDFNLHGDEYWIIWVVVIVLALSCLLMELRRITGRPKRFFYEQDREKCSLWTLVFMLMPVFLIAIFALDLRKANSDANSILELNASGVLTPDALANIYQSWSFNTAIQTSKMGMLVLMNVLMYRYLLMYFPQLSYTGDMVMRLLKPLLFTLLFLTMSFFVFGAFLYVLYSASFAEFSDVPSASVMTVKMMMGGVSQWRELYLSSPTMWTFVVSLFFVVIGLFLNNMAVAIMLSHKKEKDLFENYNYNIFWSNARSKFKDPKDFNPATYGWDFTENIKEPFNPNKKF